MPGLRGRIFLVSIAMIALAVAASSLWLEERLHARLTVELENALLHAA